MRELSILITALLLAIGMSKLCDHWDDWEYSKLEKICLEAERKLLKD